MPRRKSSSNHSSQDEVVNAEWNNDELTSMSAVVQDVKEDAEEVESESLAAQDNNIHEHSPGSIEDSSGVHNQLGRRCEIGDADSFEDKAGSEDKRNLSLEALFQAAHTELQNFSKHSEEIGECSKSQSNSVFPDAASCISDVDDSVSIVIQTPSGEKVTGKLVKVINKKGQQKLKIRTSGPATAMLSDMQLISNSSPQSSVEVLSSPLVLNAPSLDSNTESLSPLTPKTPGLVNVQGIMVQPKPNVIPKFTETHSGGRKRKHPEKPGKHICPYCARRCAKPSVLVKHIRAHTGERPYPCVPCGFSFKTKSNLYKHCKSRSHAMKVGSKSGTEDVEMSTEMEIPVLQGYEDDDEEGDDEEEDEVRQSDGDALSSLSVPSMLTEKSAASNHTTQTIATAVPVQQVYTVASEVITNNDPLSVTCTIAEASNPIWVMDPVPSSEGTMVIGAHSAKVALPTPQSKAPVVIQASESTNIQSPMLSPGMGSHPKLESMLVTGSTVLGTPEACSDGTATCRSARPPSLSAIKKHLTPDGLLDHISWLISSNEAIIDTPMAEAPRPKRLPMSRQGSDNSNLQVTHSSAVLSRSVTDPTSGRSSHVLQRQASVCELSPAPTSMIIPMPNQPSLDAPSMVQMAGEGGQQQLVFLGLAEPSDQPPGSISQEMSSNQVEVLTVVPQSVKMPPIVGSPATSLPSEIKIQFKLPRKSEDDGQVTEQSDGRSDLNPEGSAIKDLLLQDKSQKFTPEGGEVIHVIDKVPAESSGEGTLTCPMCGFSASCQEDFDSHRMNSCPSQGLLVVVHEDGTEETILVTIGEQEVMTGGDDIHVATTPNPPQAITGHQVQGLPAPKATASLKTIPPCKADHLKPDLKLSIPSYSQDLGSLQNGLSVMSANQCRISSTPDTGETINPSPIPDWKLQLKGHLLMKRSLSVERLLSEEKEEKNKLESLSVDTKASLGHPNILKRSHSADVNSVTTPTKRRILPEITESEDCNMTYESEESSKELASPVCRTIVITDTDDKQSPCAPALCVAVVKQVSEMDTSSVITAPCIRLHGYSAPLPPVLAIPSILAEKIPGFPRKAEDAVSDVECEKALENQNKLSPVLIETSEEVTIEDVAETESDAAVVRKTDSAPASIIHEHVMVRLKLDSGEIDGKMTAALMLLGNSLPSLRSVAYSTFCSVLKPQPCYVEQGPNDKISMYSNWKTAIGSVNIMGLSIKEVLSLYKTQFFDPNPVYCNSQITKLKSALLTHSSYWTAKKDGSKSKQKCDKILQASSPGNESKLRTLTQIPDLIFTDSSCQEDVPLGMVQSVVQTENRSSSSGRKKLHQILVDRVSHSNQQRVKICPGGYKSNEDYIYVRGRGRGKYVCEECGIRCKKPSMLKKHIRTHTDLRPYRCQFCCFKFKTKGNLTKHMKSKAHHKRCVDLGISPVPVYIDSTNVDPEALTEQGHISKDNYEGEGQMSDVEDEVEGDEEEDDEEDEEVEQEELEVEVKTVEVHSEVSGGGLQDLPHYREVSGGGLQDLPHYREVSGGGLQDLPHYIAIQSDQVAKPSLFCISSGGQTIFHLDSTAQSGIGAGDGGQAGSPRASIDKEIAASLLDLSKGTDDLTTTFKSCAGDSRLTHLIGALISRTTEADTAPLGDINSKGDDLSVKDVAGGVSSEPSYMTGFRPPLLIVSSSDLIKVTGDPLKAKTVVMPNFNSKLTGTITTTTITNATLNCGTTVQPPLVCGAVATSCLTSPSEMNPSTKFATGNTKAPFEIIPVPGKVSDVTDCQNGKYKCGVCEAEFNQAHQLTLHNKIHLIECLHKCNDCALAFRTKPLLSKHLRSERHQAKVKLKTHFGVNQGSIETNEPRPFKCDDCNVAFRFHGHLSKHLRSRMHILELEMLGKLPAGSAEKLESQDLGDLSTLDSQSNLESLHSMLAFADGQSRSEEVTNYCCQPCLLTFENKFQLNTHLASDEHLVVVGGPLEGQVERLDTKTESPRQSASASESRVEERLVCGTCQLTCMNEESLRKHSKTAHGTQTPSEDITSGNRPAEVTSLIGEVTNRTRSSDKIPTLKHGMLTRMRRLAYMCDICGDAFTNEQDLVTHVSTHSLVKPSVSAELRPYVCEYCDGGFPSMQSLRIHLTTHKEERPYVCGMCGAQFASADHLKQHSITHIDQSSYPSGIVVCGEEKASEVGGIMCVGVGSGEVGVVEEELVVEDGIITDDTMVHHVIMDPTELSQHQLQDQQLSEHQQQDQQLSEYQIQEPNLAENRNPVSVRDNQPVVGQGRLLLPSDTHSATGDAPKEGENEGSSQRLTSSISYSHDLTGGSDVVTVDNDDPHTVSDRHPNSHLS